MTLCQVCAAKSCLEHLTAMKLSRFSVSLVPYPNVLLCSDCVDRNRQTKTVVLLFLLIGLVIALAANAG